MSNRRSQRGKNTGMTNYAAAGRQATTAPNADPDNHPILVDTTDAVRTITLNRPERRNAMSPTMQEELIST